jgi:hypothetical protein
MARRQRRRPVEEALEDERAREALLAERLEEVVAEDESPRIDELAFARMQPEDVEVVRGTLGEPPVFGEDEEEYEADDSAPLDRAELDGEVARLQEEISESQRRQRAFARYLEALAELGEQRA